MEKIRRRRSKIRAKQWKKIAIFGSALGVLIAIILTILYKSFLISLLGLIGFPIALFIFVYFKSSLEKSSRIQKMEAIFPDFLQIMSSNLRAGMTIDKAMLLSSREEFAPLDQEIMLTGKDIATGKEIETALVDMSKRINSEKIQKTVLLIISGIRSGGNLAVLLEETSVSMRERGFVEKRASSNVLMYVIFIFVAVAFGAPALFSLSSILVEVLTTLLSNVPEISAAAASGRSLPFTLSSINISTKFIFYFALSFMFVIDLLASLVIGLVSKGQEKEGLKYFLPLLGISYAVFFIAKALFGGFLSGLF